MLMPCGPSAVPTGGAGVAWPAGIWIFTTAANLFFAISFARSLRRRVPAPRTFARWRATSARSARLRLPLHLSELRDLAELELDWCLTSEDVHEHRELRTGDVDVGDRAVEVGERSGNDA